MNYLRKSAEEIFLKELQDALEKGLISHQEEFEKYIKNKQDISNFYIMLLAIHADVFEEVYDSMNIVYSSSKVSLAEGSDLDDIGEIINCPRPTPTRACVELTFSIRGYTEDASEPAGIKVATPTEIVYETVEPLNFTEDIRTCTVLAYAVTPGTGSRVVENTLTRIQSNLEHSVTVTNPRPSTGGADGFNDEQYRGLLKEWVKTNQKGNKWAYEDYFARLDGLEDYKLVPNWDGSGTIKVIISPSSAYFLNKVYEGLQSEVTQISEDIVVLAPEDKKIDIFVDCDVDIDRINPYSSSEKEIIKSKIEHEIKNFVENLKIGEDFIPHKLAVFLDQEIDELKNISFNLPVEPIKVNDEEKCSVGNIEVVME